MIRRRIQHKSWVKEGLKRFGADSNLWRFKCPSCGQIQSKLDLISAGEGKMAEHILGFSCIGTVHVRRGNGSKVVGFLEPSIGFGCTYEGMTNNCSPIEMIVNEIQSRYTFDWAQEHERSGPSSSHCLRCLRPRALCTGHDD